MQDGKTISTTARLLDWVEIDGAKFFKRMVVTLASSPDVKKTSGEYFDKCKPSHYTARDRNRIRNLQTQVMTP